jgi:hypothetical protein
MRKERGLGGSGALNLLLLEVQPSYYIMPIKIVTTPTFTASKSPPLFRAFSTIILI